MATLRNLCYASSMVNKVSVGQRIGKVTVVSRSSKKDRFRGSNWICTCDCGRSVERTGRALRQALQKGQNTSCGCVRADHCRKIAASGAEARGYINKGLGTFRNFLYGKYRASAERRGIPFLLPRDKFDSLTAAACHYCGLPPFQRLTLHRKGVHLTYTGIDRLQNEEGYTVENSVPCCKYCNVAKGGRTLADFIGWVKLVASHSPKNQDPRTPRSPKEEKG